MSTRNIVVGVLVLITGLLVLLGGVALHVIPLGILGFLVMGGGVYLALTKPKYGAEPAVDRKSGTRPGTKQKSGFMNGLEEKWEERRRDQ